MTPLPPLPAPSLSEVAKCACCILTAMALKPEYKRVILASQALPGRGGGGGGDEGGVIGCVGVQQVVFGTVVSFQWRMAGHCCVRQRASCCQQPPPLHPAFAPVSPSLSPAPPGILHLLSLHTEAVTPGVSRRAVEAITALVQGSRTLQELVRTAAAAVTAVTVTAGAAAGDNIHTPHIHVKHHYYPVSALCCLFNCMCMPWALVTAAALCAAANNLLQSPPLSPPIVPYVAA